MKNWKTITLLTLGILALVMILQNTAVVTVRLLFWKVQMSQIILLPVMLLIGFGAGFFVARRKRG
jgi:uncharacterized integral membrane protein